MGTHTEKEIWYLARDGKKHGPITDGEMRKLMELGHLKGDDLVWRPGYQDWRKALSVFSSLKLDHKIERKPPQKSEQATASSEDAKRGYHKVSEEVRKSIASETSQLLKREKPPIPLVPKETEPVKNTKVVTPSSEDQATYELEEDEDEDTSSYQEGPQRSPFNRRIYFSILLGFMGAIFVGGYVYSTQIKMGVNLVTLVLSSRKEPPSQTSLNVQKENTKTAAIDPPKGPQQKSDTKDQDSKIDRHLQKSPLWVLLKRKFPDWYQAQVEEIKKMQAAQKTDTQINTQLTEALVSFRRQKARMGLAASTHQFQKIASTFVTHLTVLEKSNVEDCYGYISKGEMSPYGIRVTQDPTEGQALHAHIEAVMGAIVEGEKSPSFHEQPQKMDYDLLAKELGNVGWSEADIQFFANPQTLSNAPPAQVCKMVREWFTAHLTITDDKARERLLYQTLKPLIAG